MTDDDDEFLAEQARRDRRDELVLAVAIVVLGMTCFALAVWGLLE